MKPVTLSTALLASAALLSACGGGGGGGNTGGGGGGGGGTTNGCPAPNDQLSFLQCSGNVYTLSGTVDEDFTMQSQFDWRLSGTVRVGAGNVTVNNQADVDAIKAAGVTLTVQPGTNVRANADGILLVTRGSRIEANGTVNAPITFSSLDNDFDGLGEWGGIVLQGFATQFGGGNTGACTGGGEVCNVTGEGGNTVALYGGNDDADSSGTLRYVRIAEGGLVDGPDNEVNGLTMQGVGHGTTIEYVQVHNNLDDAFEWFGGTVNARYLVATGNDDDSIDYDEGWRGNVQYGIVIMDQNKPTPTGSNDPRGIEANSDGPDDFVPQTNGTLANLTIIGSAINDGQPGARLRGAVTTGIYNSAIGGFDSGCVRIQDEDTANSVITFVNVLTNCAGGTYQQGRAANTDGTISQAFTLDEAFSIVEGVANVGATVIPPTANGSSFTFDQTSYIGAIAPGTSAGNAWWSGWTLPGTISTASQAPAPASFVSCNGSSTVCTVTGTIDQDYTFTAGVEWRLSGTVRVGTGNEMVNSLADVAAVKAAGVTLTVEPGVNVKGLSDGVLLVTRGSRIEANGTANAPITFSSLDGDFDGLGEWGGIVVQGFATQFGSGNTGACNGVGDVCNVTGEGGSTVALYGGTDDDDDSGTLRYVRIAEGGLVAGPDNEVNGLTLQGVGYNTTIEYVQVHNNLDDAFEWFGGTANARYIVATNNDDDSIDYDEGARINVQYAIVIMDQNPAATPTGSNDPRGIEANSDGVDDYVPQTMATISNATIIGGAINAGQPGFRLRGAVTTGVYNSAVGGFDAGCVRIQDEPDANPPAVSVINFVNLLTNCAGGTYQQGRDADIDGTTELAFTIDNAFALTDLAASVAAPVIPEIANGSGFTHEATTYVGAVEPGTPAGSAWWAGWTFPGTVSLP